MFRRDGSTIVVLGQSRAELGGSEYLKLVHQRVAGQLPTLDLVAEHKLQQFLVSVIADGLLESAHDCAEGGTAVTLAECCFESGGIGLEVSLPPVAVDDGMSDELTLAATLFGETASCVVASVEESQVAELLNRAGNVGVPARVVGRTGGSRFRLSVDGASVIDCPLDEIERVWAHGLARHLGVGAV